MMSEFMARQIMKQADISLEKGQEKYRVYFIKNARLYAKYQPDCDAILEVEGYGDCIVES